MNTQVERRWKSKSPDSPILYWFLRANSNSVYYITKNDSNRECLAGTYSDNYFGDGYEETFDHLPLPEKNGELTQRCPMDTCLAPQRLKVLEDFYEEVCRIQNEESGNMRVGLALSRAIAKVHNNE